MKSEFERLRKWENELAICIRCGYCYEYCPLFKTSNWEVDTPRGKLLLLYGLLSGEVKITAESVETLVQCFYGMNCSKSCSAKVPVTDIFTDARADLLDAGFDPEGTIVRNDEELCGRCGICISICKHEALTMHVGENDDRKVLIDKVKCTGCGVCIAACPSGAMSQKEGFEVSKPELYDKVLTLLER